MIKVLVDTNVALDAIAAREPFRNNAEKIFLLIGNERAEGYITSNSVTDIYYIARKSLSGSSTRKAIKNLFTLFSVIGVLGDDCEAALDLPIEDYEDALILVCAHKAGVNYIVTRDENFLQVQAPIPILSPEMFLDVAAKATQ